MLRVHIVYLFRLSRGDCAQLRAAGLLLPGLPGGRRRVEHGDGDRGGRLPRGMLLFGRRQHQRPQETQDRVLLLQRRSVQRRRRRHRRHLANLARRNLEYYRKTNPFTQKRLI